MKLTVEKEAIITGLQTAASIIPAKAGAAYLRSIWLKASAGALAIMATDANLEFTGVYKATVETEGLTGVQGRLFVDLINKLPNGPIHLELDAGGNLLHIRRGRNSYKLTVASSDWFQPFSSCPEEGGVIWSGGVFGEYMDRVSYCIDEEDSSDPLGCLFMKHTGQGKIAMCGLNGHQFGLVNFINDSLAEKLPEKGLLIERKYLPEIRKWLSPDEIELHITDKYIYLKKENACETLSVPRAHYDYPDFNVFMEKLEVENVSRLTMARQEAAEAYARLLVFYSEQDRAVNMELKPEELTLLVRAGEVGSARESLEVEYKGDIDRIAFPTKDLVEIFSHFVSDDINMVFSGIEGPCGITGSGEGDKDYIVIIMPMKVPNGAYYSED